MTDFNSTLLCREPFARHTAFTLWRLEPHPKKPIKVPVHYDGTTRHQTDNPAPPLTAEQCLGWLAYHRTAGFGCSTPGEVGYIGAGFRPAGTGLVCVDMDDCIAAGTWTPGALALMARFPGALIEQSTSGRGLHIWFTVAGEMPGRRGQVQTPLGKLEMYSDGQFLACGTVLAGDASVDHTAAAQALLAEFWPLREDRADPGGVAEWDARSAEERAAVLADLAGALAVLDPDNRDEWISNGQSLRSLGEDGYRLWAEWSARSTRFPGGDGLDKWDTFSGERTDYRAVLARAQRSGWVNPAQRPALPSDASAVFAVATPASSPLPAGAVLTPPPGRAVAAASGLSFMAASEGAIKPSVATVETGLLSPEAGVKIAYDVFKDRISIAVAGGDWRQLRDTDYGRLRAAFERQGFKAVPHEIMQTAVAMVAEQNQFDSLEIWANGLKWDGVPRIDRLLPDYYSAEDTPYTRAVGEYAFTTLGGRAIVPGVKADMAIIMVGLQGVGKTSALEVLVPEPDAFGEVDLGHNEETIARMLRGKSLIELAEMRGFKGRDADANKAWVSRRKEEWTPKYKEFNTTYWRRCLIVGTANDDEQLDDPTGARRFLPVHVGKVNGPALVRDRDQLWAEGVHKFKQSGVAWQEAERLARAEHHKFEVVNELQDLVEAFMATPPTPKPGEPLHTTPRSAHPIRGVDILTGCYGMVVSQIKKSDEMALAKIMKKLGYIRVNVYPRGKAVKMWRLGGM